MFLRMFFFMIDRFMDHESFGCTQEVSLIEAEFYGGTTQGLYTVHRNVIMIQGTLAGSHSCMLLTCLALLFDLQLASQYALHSNMGIEHEIQWFQDALTVIWTCYLPNFNEPQIKQRCPLKDEKKKNTLHPSQSSNGFCVWTQIGLPSSALRISIGHFTICQHHKAD